MTPWQIAGASEHSQQSALFAWANCATHYGVDAANDERAYTLVNREQIPQAIKLLWKPAPEFKRLFAIHNQGHGDKVRGGFAKAEGVKPGVPDLCWPLPNSRFHGLFIELKREIVKGKSKGVVSADQTDWGNWLLDKHYAFYVCYGWREAADILTDYWKVD